MRLPNPKEVERAVYYGERMRLRTIDATVRLSTWTASVGAKAKMQKAWVRVSNIPLDKRTEKIAYYAGSLVGVSLELDMSTLHKPEFVRLLIGCKDVETMADSAEGVLGDDFYDFYYEIERIVVGGPPKQTSTVVVDGSGVVPSPKRARTTYTTSATEETSVEQGNGSQTDSVRYGKNYDSGKDICGADEDSPDDSMEDQELFLDKLARENKEAEMEMRQEEEQVPVDKWLVPYLGLEKDYVPAGEGIKSVTVLPAFTPSMTPLDKSQWPNLVEVSDITTQSGSPVMVSQGYTVQSPVSSPVDEVEEIHGDPVLGCRFSARIHDGAMEDMVEKASFLSRKRNLEGNIDTPHDKTNSFSVLSNKEIIVRASMMGARIPDK
jgi:hypothetical protein